jgi:hypothetical protein
LVHYSWLCRPFCLKNAELNRLTNKKHILEAVMTGFVDFVQRSGFYETRRFGICICFCPQVEEWETPTTLHPLESVNHNHWKEIDLVSEILCLEHRTMDKDQKSSQPECYTPQSEHCRNPGHVIERVVYWENWFLWNYFLRDHKC